MQLRRMGMVLVTGVLGAVLAAPASAVTELDLFSNRIGKSAAEYSAGIVQKHKLACVCINSPNTALISAAGVLRRGTSTVGGVTRVRVDCWVPSFDAAGGGNGATACYDFVPLPK